MAAQFRRIARVAKAHGTKGEVVAVPVGGLPPVLAEGVRVAVVPPELKGSRWHEVERVETSAAGQLVRLTGVDDLGEARALVGKSLLVEASLLPEGAEYVDEARLVGRVVRDLRLGPIGRIEAVEHGPAQDVWVVRGDAGETLVPAVPELVAELREEGDVVVDLPVGLVPGDGGEEDTDAR